jgi:tetratricopeptide (TPR) repeat protein
MLAKRSRGPIGLLLLLAFCLLLVLMPLNRHLNQRSHRSNTGGLPAVADLGGIFRVLEIAGLNALLADLLWMKADEMWHSTSWWEMAPTLEAIVRIDPKFPMVWKILAWHYGWNLNFASPSAIEKRHWLDKAAETYNRALEAVPDDQGLWSDACFFFADRSRQWDTAEVFLKKAIAKYPLEIPLFRRRLQRVYEKSWRVDDAIKVIQGIQQVSPGDAMASRDLAWWRKWDHDRDWRWVLEYREDVTRAKRYLPWFRNPFEGTLVKAPPWRDWNAPQYMNPNWQPDLTKFEYESVSSVFLSRPDLKAQWQKAHPEVKLTRPK